MTDGTKADGSLAGRQCSPVLGDQWLQKQILFYCVSLIDHELWNQLRLSNPGSPTS